MSGEEKAQATKVSNKTPLLWIIVGGVLLVLVVAASIAGITYFVMTSNASKTSKDDAGKVSKDDDDCSAALAGPHIYHGEFCAKHSSTAQFPFRKLDGDTMSLVVIGDFGRDGLCCQNDVAMEMALASDQLSKTRGVISVGDNFYPNGIT